MTSHFQDGGHDVISRKKQGYVPSVEPGPASDAFAYSRSYSESVRPQPVTPAALARRVRVTSLTVPDP